VHESYQMQDDFQADIALLSLETEVQLNQNIIPACFSPDVDLIQKDAVGDVCSYFINDTDLTLYIQYKLCICTCSGFLVCLARIYAHWFLYE
jgi:hypothetical protein